MTRMNVSLQESLVEELRSLIPRRQRSQFIAEAVQAKLAHLKQERAVEAAAGIWSSEGRADPDQEIQALRSAWQKRAWPPPIELERSSAPTAAEA